MDIAFEKISLPPRTPSEPPASPRLYSVGGEKKEVPSVVTETELAKVVTLAALTRLEFSEDQKNHA